MIQAMALGEVKGLDEMRRVVKNSFTTNIYKPEDSDVWSQGYKRLLKIVEK